MYGKSIVFLVLSLLVIPVTVAFAYTGEVDTFFTTPGPCPTGLVFCGKNIWVADRKTDSLRERVSISRSAPDARDRSAHARRPVPDHRSVGASRGSPDVEWTGESGE